MRMTLEIKAETKRNEQEAEIRRQKILAYAETQAQRTDEEKENDFHDSDEYQAEWVERKIKSQRWERCNGMIEEWTPWNRFTEPINQWRYYKK
jgi:hypothetical protein